MQDWNWTLIFQIIYIIILVLVCLRIIYDTRSPTKTLAYLLFAIFVPFFGMAFYFAFGTNYRKRKLYTNKLERDVYKYARQAMAEGSPEVKEYKELAIMLLKDSFSPVTNGNDVKVLVNGENKFPDVLESIKNAKHHIHMEYYIYADDETGGMVADALIKKAQEGVEIRFMYDAFGSSGLRKKMVKKLKAANIAVFPFYKIIFIFLASRINYRNHRKIIVIDGKIAFVGGINVSDKYVNKDKKKKKLFWRDTHLMIEGPGVYYLQYLFLCDWNFCSKEGVLPDPVYFPKIQPAVDKGKSSVQIAASGPDSDVPTILFSLLQGINLAKKEVLITTPYFIPGESILDALMAAALGGVSVKLLVPGKSDSGFVNAAAKSHYEDLLKAGVEIYMYQLGFVHAKTMVIDREVGIVGSANMDFRSFDLNFEANAIVYDPKIAEELAEDFAEDLEGSIRITLEEWQKRPLLHQLYHKIAGLFSPIL